MSKKVDVGFRFSEEVDARLKELALIWGQTRTAWLEEVIMSFDIESEREAAAEERGLPHDAAGILVLKDEVSREVVVKAKPFGEAVGGVKRRQSIPKAGWKK